MRAEKQVVANLKKPYAVAAFDYGGSRHVVCSAEKAGPCYSFSLEGRIEDTIWEQPGGVMTILQYPLSESMLMATQNFFSPDQSASAKIVYYRRNGPAWSCNVLCEMPFVHRFGVLRRNNSYYLIACTIKSASAFEEDWTCPGRVWVSGLPNDLTKYNSENQLQMTPFMSGLYKNHGFSIVDWEEGTYAMIGTDNGVYRIFPPSSEGGSWSYDQILSDPVSDMLYQDYDGDGERELLTLSPFHGDTLSVYKRQGGKFSKIWERKEKMPFIHALCGADIEGKEYAFIGHRKGNMDLVALHYDNDSGYKIDLIDSGHGPANCMYFRDSAGKHKLIVSNRETDEVAFYTLIPDD